MRVLETIEKYKLIKKGQKVAVSVSGGSDSMALLHFLNGIKNELGIAIICINIEHGIRGKESKKDSLFVKDYCKKNNIEFLGFAVDVLTFKEQNGYTIEQAARILRYDIYDKIISDKKADLIATAHNRMDRAEGILLNLFRGSGINGIIMEFKRGNIIRPLLETSKEEILEYIKSNKISYVIDSSNLDKNYSRNYVRHEIMPKVLEKFPQAEEALVRFSENLKPDNDYLNLKAEDYVLGGSVIKKKIHSSILKRAVFLALKNIGVVSDIESVHIEAISKLYFKGKSGDEIYLPKNIVCYNDYDKITFTKKQEKIETIFPFKIGITKICGYVLEVTKTCDMNDKENALYIKKDLPKNTVIRTRRDNDTFKRFGGGTKSLSDYFTDIKLEKRHRDFIPVIAADSEIIAVISYNISENYKVEDFSKEFFKIKFIKEG